MRMMSMHSNFVSCLRAVNGCNTTSSVRPKYCRQRSPVSEAMLLTLLAASGRCGRVVPSDVNDAELHGPSNRLGHVQLLQGRAALNQVLQHSVL